MCIPGRASDIRRSADASESQVVVVEAQVGKADGVANNHGCYGMDGKLMFVVKQCHVNHGHYRVTMVVWV